MPTGPRPAVPAGGASERPVTGRGTPNDASRSTGTGTSDAKGGRRNGKRSKAAKADQTKSDDDAEDNPDEADGGTDGNQGKRKGKWPRLRGSRTSVIR
jgi:hypothetical protein